MKKVVLFFPSYRSREAAPPLALIALAGPLVSKGYEVEIVDAAIERDYVRRAVEAARGALCVGISIITGPMIEDTVRVGNALKEAHPDLPIVLGGWHPSILPEQTLEADFVDVVAIRQGELTLLELAERFANFMPLDGVAGTLFKRDGEIVRNAPRAHTPIEQLPSRMPGYDLIDYDHYERQTGLRWVMYTSSHGCPYNCGYCSNASVYGRKLDTLPVEQVVDEVSFLVRRKGVRYLGIIDDIFFAQTKRSLAMAEGFVRAGLDFKWYIQDRADCIARLTEDQAKLYARAGLHRIHFGAESGSDEVLKAIEKKAAAEDAMRAVERCKSAGIRASFGFIFGLPSETDHDLEDSLALIDRIYATYDRADCYTNIFTPYPGSPIWDETVGRGFEMPKRFEDWSSFFPQLTELPWLDGDRHARLQNIRQYLRLGYPVVKVGEVPRSRAERLAQRTLGPIARYRVRHHAYGFPAELRALDTMKTLKRRAFAQPTGARAVEYA
jgi:anaerobic magnesium-protoporphyrin IX monomethyl ester cyclase